MTDEWCLTAFDELYAVLYAHRTVEAARPEADFAVRVTGVQQGDDALDLCCGNGRHSLRLREYGLNLRGVDYSSSQIVAAQVLLGETAQLVRADMRAIPFADASFDALFSFFTSFGYFADDAENESVAREIARVLRPGGRLFMDHANAAHVRATLAPESRRTIADYDVHERRWVDSASRVNKKAVVRRMGERVAEIDESVRLYEPEEMTTLMGRAGLTVDAFWGDFSGTPLGSDSPRMLMLARK